MDVDALVAGVLAGDRRAVARAISAVEDGAEELPSLSAGLYGRTGAAATIGLTGAPGVGKSTLGTELVRRARADGHPVAVLAVDPTSPYTGGALLGDRVRMQEHATDPGVFIRSMATRGHLGGMALAAPEAVRILDAAGYARIIVETVGVGQAEVDVAAATDSAVVVLAPGLGDAVQMAKAGILEVADVFVVNKADREGARDVVRELRQMLHLGAARDWEPPVLETAALAGEGIDELWAAIEDHRAHVSASGALAAKRRGRLLREVESLAAERFRTVASGALEGDAALIDDLTARRIDPYGAAAMLVRLAAEADRLDGWTPPAAGGGSWSTHTPAARLPTSDRTRRAPASRSRPSTGPTTSSTGIHVYASGCRGATPSPVASTPRCTGDVAGRCGSSPDSGPPPRRTRGTGSSWSRARVVSLWRSTCRR